MTFMKKNEHKYYHTYRHRTVLVILKNLKEDDILTIQNFKRPIKGI